MKPLDFAANLVRSTILSVLLLLGEGPGSILSLSVDGDSVRFAEHWNVRTIVLTSLGELLYFRRVLPLTTFCAKS